MGKHLFSQWLLRLHWYWWGLLGAVFIMAFLLWLLSLLDVPAAVAANFWLNLLFLLCFLAGLFCGGRATWLYLSESFGLLRPDPPRATPVTPVAQPKQEHWILDPAAIAAHESVDRGASRTACVMPRPRPRSQAEPQPILLQDYRVQYQRGGKR